MLCCSVDGDVASQPLLTLTHMIQHPHPHCLLVSPRMSMPPLLNVNECACAASPQFNGHIITIIVIIISFLSSFASKNYHDMMHKNIALSIHEVFLLWLYHNSHLYYAWNIAANSYHVINVCVLAIIRSYPQAALYSNTNMLDYITYEPEHTWP